MIRLFTDEELPKIANPKNADDRLLATIFMNCTAFSERQYKHYPYKFRHIYVCTWGVGLDKEDVITDTIYACDPKSLKQYLDMEYMVMPDAVAEKLITSQIVKLPK